MNAEEYYRPTQNTRAHGVSGLPAVLRASVINFVIIRKFSNQISSVQIYIYSV